MSCPTDRAHAFAVKMSRFLLRWRCAKEETRTSLVAGRESKQGLARFMQVDRGKQSSPAITTAMQLYAPESNKFSQVSLIIDAYTT